MRYCGTCGRPLEADELAAGSCPACGTPVAADSASGGASMPADAPSAVEYFARVDETPRTPAARADTPTILSGMPLPPPSTPKAAPGAANAPGMTNPAAAMDAARWPNADGASALTDRTARMERRGLSGALAALAVALAALALVVAVVGMLGALGRLGPVSVLLRNDPPLTGTTPAPGAALPAATTTTTTASSSPQPGPRSTPATEPGATPGASVTAGPTPVGTPSATGTPLPTGTPIPSDAPPTLAVDPSSRSVPLTQCLIAQASTSFTVKNSGGGTLDWAATTTDGYTISPSSGTLAAGDSPVTVNVTKIGGSGQITVTAPGIAGSPQTVTIRCSL